jgi:hypothetical protein
MVIVTLFLVLDFAKRVDDAFLGLTFAALATNVFVVMLLVAWPLGLFLALLSTAVERAGFGKLVLFSAALVFLTVNLWSIKAGIAAKLVQVIPPHRARAGYAASVLVVVAAGVFCRRSAARLTAIEANRRPILKFLSVSTLLAAGGFLLIPAAPAPYPSNSPNVILVTFDGMSASHMSLYGYERETTPNIDRLAQESWVFENFRALANTTQPSLVALHGHTPDMVRQRGLFEILQANGYPHRAFFSYSSPRTPFYRDIGHHEVTRSGKKSFIYKAASTALPESSLLWLSCLLSEEFATYWPYNSDYDDDIFWKTNHYPGDLSLQSALNYLREHPTGAFVWVHLWEPHYPYWPDPDLVNKFGPVGPVPPEFIHRPYREGQAPWVASLKNRYDQSVLTADRLFGRFLDELKQTGLYDSSFLVVSADHGESLGDGYIGHSGPSLLESITRVPLLIHAPENREPKRIETVAGHLDLAPTLLELLNIPPVPNLPGESLVPYIKHSELRSDRTRKTLSYSAARMPFGPIALYWKNYKVIYESSDPSKVSLFDLSSDPKAAEDIAKVHPDIVATILTQAGVRQPQPK